jgi:hypothetical protein
LSREASEAPDDLTADRLQNAQALVERLVAQWNSKTRGLVAPSFQRLARRENGAIR